MWLHARPKASGRCAFSTHSGWARAQTMRSSHPPCKKGFCFLFLFFQIGNHKKNTLKQEVWHSKVEKTLILSAFSWYYSNWTVNLNISHCILYAVLESLLDIWQTETKTETEACVCVHVCVYVRVHCLLHFLMFWFLPTRSEHAADPFRPLWASNLVELCTTEYSFFVLQSSITE